jgi:predicted acyl esterase
VQTRPDRARWWVYAAAGDGSRDGLETADPAPGTWVAARVEFLPQDFTFQPDHRIGLIVQSSNTVWALPGAAGTANILTGPLPDVSDVGSRLVLPLSRAPAL